MSGRSIFLAAVVIGTSFMAAGFIGGQGREPNQTPNQPLQPANGAGPIQAVDVPNVAGVYETMVEFPLRSPQKQTAWKVWWQVSRDKAGRENFHIVSSWFRTDMVKSWTKVTSDIVPAELCSAYTDGTRFYDVKGFRFGLFPMTQADAGAPATGAVLGRERKVVGELRDRGVLWKRGSDVVRGDELCLWACFKAGNYDYLIHYGFQDDGILNMKVAYTGINHGHQPGPEIAHMHNACWRIDIDLGETSPNKVYLVSHKEPHGEPGLAKDLVEPFNNGHEGFADWNPREFTHLRVENPNVKNRRNNPIAYDLIPIMLGTGRHFNTDQSPNQKGSNNQMKLAQVKNEDFTQHDFWVTPYAAGETDYTELPRYISQGRKLGQFKSDNQGNRVLVEDVVLWHMSSLYHIPRDEDMVGARAGVALAAWSACMLRPRNLFDQTPFYFPPKMKVQESRPINQ